MLLLCLSGLLIDGGASEGDRRHRFVRSSQTFVTQVTVSLRSLCDTPIGSQDVERKHSGKNCRDRNFESSYRTDSKDLIYRTDDQP